MSADSGENNIMLEKQIAQELLHKTKKENMPLIEFRVTGLQQAFRVIFNVWMLDWSKFPW